MLNGNVRVRVAIRQTVTKFGRDNHHCRRNHHFISGVHSSTLLLQAENLPVVHHAFQQILPTVDFFYLLDCLTITGLDRTYHAHYFIYSFTF